jgi:hypothetical protein
MLKTLYDSSYTIARSETPRQIEAHFVKLLCRVSVIRLKSTHRLETVDAMTESLTTQFEFFLGVLGTWKVVI